MKDIITRRRVLKGLAVFPLVSALTPLAWTVGRSSKSSALNSRATLYLCFHGLFAFVFYDDHITVITPELDEHVYIAGAWEKEERLVNGQVYLLLGANDPTHPNPRPTLDKDNLFLSGVKNIDLKSSYCVLNVPFPNEFISLRHTAAEFEGSNLPAPQVSSVPLLQVLKYDVPDSAHLKLEPFPSWKPGSKATLYLHYFAEPDIALEDSHPTHAFNELMKLLPEVNVRLKAAPSQASCPLVESKGTSVALLQQLSLAERGRACELAIRHGSKELPDRGARPANCFSVIVNAK